MEVTVVRPLGNSLPAWRGATIRDMDAAEVHAQRRSLSDPLVEQLAASEDPVLAYKSSLLAGVDPSSVKARSMWERIPSSAIARALLRVFEQDGCVPGFRRGLVARLRSPSLEYRRERTNRRLSLRTNGPAGKTLYRGTQVSPSRTLNTV